MLSRLTATALGLALALGLSAGPALAEDPIRIGTEGAYAPFNFIDENGDLQGFDVDIAKALCAAMEAQCEFVVQDWDGIIPGLLAKKYDAIVASMSITEERKEKVAFTNKYYATPARFVKPKSVDVEITKEGLDGKVVGVQRATIHENFINDNYGDVVEVRSYASQEEANMDLASGRVDLIIADSVVLDESFLQTDAGADFEFVGPGFTDVRWFGEGVGIAVRKEDTDLVKRFNAAIEKIRADGTYDKVAKKYFDFDVYGEPTS